MARSSDSNDRAVTDEGKSMESDEAVRARPDPEMRWVQLREPRHAVEIGQNGRVLASHYHEGDDSWEVLLETYEGELSE